MRISDWSSDVCSFDLLGDQFAFARIHGEWDLHLGVAQYLHVRQARRDQPIQNADRGRAERHPDKPNKQRQSKQAANVRHVLQYLYNTGGVGAFRSSQDVQSAETEHVGWLEHSETHRFPATMGFAALSPFYLDR